AIYRFRGATTGAFDQFQKHFPAVKFVTLEQNRRSTSPILRCAFKVIDQNPAIMAGGGIQRKPLISARERDPNLAKEARMGHLVPVELVYTPLLYSPETEAAEIADEIEKLHQDCRGHDTRSGRQGCRWKDVAVLYRQHRHRELLAAELSRRRIPIDV